MATGVWIAERDDDSGTAAGRARGTATAEYVDCRATLRVARNDGFSVLWQRHAHRKAMRMTLTHHRAVVIARPDPGPDAAIFRFRPFFRSVIVSVVASFVGRAVRDQRRSTTLATKLATTGERASRSVIVSLVISFVGRSVRVNGIRQR